MSPAASVCLAQGVIGVLAAGLVAVVWGGRWPYASLYGALVAVIPTGYFGWRALSQRAEFGTRRIAAGLARAELAKFFFTAVLFLGGVAWFAHEFPALIATYIACFAAYPLAMRAPRGN